MSKVHELAKMIDHSILHPTLTDEDLKRECEVAKKYNVASVCVKPYMVSSAVALLKDTNVLVGCVIGFPAGNSKIAVKVFETDYVAKEADLIKLCEICTKVGADYVKTSTGFGFVKGEDEKYSYEGATIPNLELMKKNVGPHVKVKAAGGVRTLDDLLAVQKAGCTRCGATATTTIIEEAIEKFGNNG